jgi:hypothetical protein
MEELCIYISEFREKSRFNLEGVNHPKTEQLFKL